MSEVKGHWENDINLEGLWSECSGHRRKRGTRPKTCEEIGEKFYHRFVPEDEQ
jgi:hypothetical protein